MTARRSFLRNLVAAVMLAPVVAKFLPLLPMSHQTGRFEIESAIVTADWLAGPHWRARILDLWSEGAEHILVAHRDAEGLARLVDETIIAREEQMPLNAPMRNDRMPEMSSVIVEGWA